jgi:membrane fusion protein (multidrug efflux system)
MDSQTRSTDTSTDTTSDKNDDAGNGRKRKRLIGAVLAVFIIGAIAYGVHWALVGRYSVSTDNAYVGGNVVQITAQVAGTVVAIGADDTQFVKAGHTLVQLDKADAEVALQQAESQLAKAVRDVRNLFAASGQQEANVQVRQADFAKATEDLARRRRLASSGAISGEEVQHAEDALKSARAALMAAQQQLAATRALVDRTTVDKHPDVQRAAAALKEAFINYARTSLPAPIAGFVAKRNVQLGQRVSPGTPLMAVIPLEQVWVDANFKEAQLADIRIGQPAKLTADLYGGKVEYDGKVIGIGAGTGSAFSLLPAQNATGNWIKIVQRVPVRIALDPKQLSEHPLQVGLSMEAKVDTHERGGERQAQVAPQAQPYKTEVFGRLEQLANERVQRIIEENEAVASSSRAPASTPQASRKAALQADRM